MTLARAASAAAAGALAVATLLLAPTARADDRAARERRARELYYTGVERFNVGEYDAAIGAWDEAYELTHNPELLYDVAQAHRRKGPESCGRAAAYLRRYRSVVPGGEGHSEVDALLEEMERCVEGRAARDAEPRLQQRPGQSSAAAASARAQRPAPRHDDTSRASSPWPWLTLGGTVVAAAGGALLWSISWEDDCRPACAPELVDGLRVRATVSYAMIAAGGLIAAGALVLWLTTSDDREPTEAVA